MPTIGVFCGKIKIMKDRAVLKKIIHLAIVGILLSSTYPFFARPEMSNEQIIKMLLYNVNLIAMYWVNTAVLIPKFVHEGKYNKYILSILGLLIFSMILLSIINRVFPDLPPGMRPQFNPEMGNGNFPRINPENGQEFRPRRFDESFGFKTFIPRFFLLPFIFQFLVMLGAGTSFELISLFDKERKRNDDMEKQKAIGELNFLKNQLNPHFLLNALNNIYSLARKKSDDTTQAVLLLSDLLRYVLYETKKTKTPIRQEIEFIKNYIQLEKLKFTDEDAPNINLSISVKNMEYPIEPLLLMTLIENSFKHGVSYLNPSFILVSLEENDKEIRFSVVNSMAKKSENKTKNTQKGLGIQTLEKQLELIYPGKHSFHQTVENNVFKTFLTIKK